jgi:hypothetical protein
VLPGVAMPFIVVDEDGRDTLVCKSSSRASSYKVNKPSHGLNFILHEALQAEISDISFVILIISLKSLCLVRITEEVNTELDNDDEMCSLECRNITVQYSLDLLCPER